MSKIRLEFPPPPTLSHPDSPPSDLVAAWLPELSEQHEAMVKALTAEHETRLRFEASAPGGSDWRAAIASDAAALKGKGKPAALAELIADTPTRYGTWYARSVVANELVHEWNQAAHERVTEESQERLVAEEEGLRTGIGEAAEEAVRAAADLGARGTDASRLTAAWKPLSELDRLAEEWRPVYAVLLWVMWEGERGAMLTQAWQAPDPRRWPSAMHTSGTATVLGRALALRDADVRRTLASFAPAVTR